MKQVMAVVGGCLMLIMAACSDAGGGDAQPVELGPDTAGADLIMDIDLSQGDSEGESFYSQPPPLPDMRRPGAFVRAEALPDELSLSAAGRADRILYVSTDGLDGRSLRLVSGAMFLPLGERPADGWPLIAWAHGTVGIADACAPSRNPRSARDTAYLNHWLSQGYAVVASDYQGLGTPGGHPYLASRPAAYSNLDAIRAVQSMDYGLSGKVVLVGQSQGGGGAFATAGLAASYAPEIDIRGTVATGTPYFTNDTAPAERDPNAVSGVFAYSLYIMYLAEQVDPEFRIADYITEAARPVIETTRTRCLMDAWRQIEAEGLSEARAFVKPPTPDLVKHFPLMAYETLRLKGPLFMGTGGRDADVPPEGQERLFRDACAAGTVIERRLYADLDHSGTVNGSLADSTPFVQKAFAGEVITGNCPSA